MEFIIVFILLVIILISGYFLFDIRIKKMKEAGHNIKLDDTTSKFPENREICEEVLKMLNNKNVKIKEESMQNNKKKTSTSLYVALTDTIFIGNIKDTYTRIQTICHECLHSIQPRRMLLFNFIYSNVYIIYFIISVILSLIGVIKDIKLQIIIISIMSFMYYVIRSYLETDAMIKAKYLAKEYMNDYIKVNPVCSKKNVEEVVQEYDKVNKLGIPAYNYVLFVKCFIKIGIIVLVGMFK